MAQCCASLAIIEVFDIFIYFFDKFFLVNKSFIVNIDRVERFTDKYIELKGIEEPIDLSREKRTAFKQKMLLYLAGQE